MNAIEIEQIFSEIRRLDLRTNHVWTPQMYLPFRAVLGVAVFDCGIKSLVKEDVIIEEPNAEGIKNYRITAKGESVIYYNG